MRASSKHGFTIIEVLLFLAISGMMIAALLVAVSGGISRERYRDAVGSFTDFMQGQYNLVDNIRNNRTVATDCSAANNDRATSDCAVIGRLVVTNAQADHIDSYPVITGAGIDIAAPISTGVSEDDYVKSLNLKHITSDSVESYDLAWQTAVVEPGSITPRLFSLLIVRSPFSSAMKTYYYDGIETDPNSIIDAQVTDTVVLCVNPDGLTNAMMGVKFDPAGVSSAAIQIATAEDCR